VLLSAAVTFWAARLGSFLFKRITADDGKDSRFDGIRESPPSLLGAFAAQAVWVSLCMFPVLAINSIPATTLAALPAMTITDVLGVLLYVGGIGFEMTADAQKTQWLKEKKEKKHSEDFLTRGLWSKSRHPNYFGESTLWTGIATVAAGVLASNVGQAGVGLSGSAIARLGALSMAVVSPAFVTFLLFKVSNHEYVRTLFSMLMQLTGFWYSVEREEVRQAVRRPEGLPTMEEEHTGLHSKILDQYSKQTYFDHDTKSCSCYDFLVTEASDARALVAAYHHVKGSHDRCSNSRASPDCNVHSRARIRHWMPTS
jgi:steroid 5-alpha reductase family enzyme